MGGPGLIDGIYHKETDNFHICKFVVDGKEYSSSENYFQAAKATSFEDHEKVRLEGTTGIKAWELGNAIKIRSDWEQVRVDEMYRGNYAKFEQNKEFLDKLIQTKGDVIFKGSTEFWNFWNGKIMERIRAEFRNTDEDKKVAAKIKEMMENYRKKSGEL